MGRLRPVAHLAPLRGLDPMGALDPVDTLDLLSGLDLLSTLNPLGALNPLRAFNPAGAVNLLIKLNPLGTLDQLGTLNPLGTLSSSVRQYHKIEGIVAPAECSTGPDYPTTSPAKSATLSACADKKTRYRQSLSAARLLPGPIMATSAGPSRARGVHQSGGGGRPARNAAAK